jgi:hypothetical protein
MNTKHTTTIVLVDPSDPDGEAGVGLLNASDRSVVLVIPIGGYLAEPLREFCRAEDVGVSAAADLYFDQLNGRLSDEFANGASDDPRTVTMHSIDGSDYVGELVELTHRLAGGRIVVPTSVTRSGGFSISRLAISAGVPLTVVPTAAALTAAALMPLRRSRWWHPAA